MAPESNVDIAFLFDCSADVESLTEALSHVLIDFPAIAARLIRDASQKFVFRCANAGVPFTYARSSLCAPAFGQPIPSEYFDLVHDVAPVDDSLGEAPLRVKVTDCADGAQVLAISCTHALGDAYSIGCLMSAWAAAYQKSKVSAARDLTLQDVLRVASPMSPKRRPKKTRTSQQQHQTRVGVLPPTPALGAQPLPWTKEVPVAWQALNAPLKAPVSMGDNHPASPKSMTVLTWHWSSEQVASMKEEFTNNADGSAISTNDALCGQLVSLNQLEGDEIPVVMVMNVRDQLDVPGFFGNVFMPLAFSVPNSASAAGKVRQTVLAARTREFVEWKWSQTPCGYERPAPGAQGLVLNTWARMIDLEKVCFERPAQDIMTGMTFWSARAKRQAGTRMRYCLVMPCRHGVKVAEFLPSDVDGPLSSKLPDGTSVQCL